MHYQYLILSPCIGPETDNLQNFKANQGFLHNQYDPIEQESTDRLATPDLNQ